jgi:acyl dehydratase
MPERELTASPAVLPMFFRAGAALIPGAAHLPFVPGSGETAPALTLVRDAVAVERPQLAAYDRVCGFSLRDTLPATYPHILAFPLHLALMTDGSFPFPAVGLVHIYNRITQHRPIDADESLWLRVWSTAIEPHPRGRQFSLRTEVRAGDELVWEEVSTNLRRGSGAAEDAEAPSVPSAEDLAPAAKWSLRGDLGRRYAAVSGDMNPIHLHALSARLFGFGSAIAHGMWTKARCLAALENRLPDAFTVEVAFRRPILLPAKVEFVEGSDSEGGTRFGVRDARKGTAYLHGVLAPAER